MIGSATVLCRGTKWRVAWPHPILLAGIAGSLSAAAGNPNPTNLLIGICAARVQVPASTLKIQCTSRDSSGARSNVFTVDFDGERRRFVADSPSGERSLFDGTQAIAFDAQIKDAQIRDIRDPNFNLLFDPRLLGLNPYSHWHLTAREAIPYERAAKVELLGREAVAGKEAWHVRETTTNATGFNVWVDDTYGFRVYRYDVGDTETVCDYKNSEYPWLPSRVVTKRYRLGTEPQLMCETEYVILGSTANVKLPEAAWSLTGLNLPLGATVSDLRTSRRLGYWNGVSVGQDPFPRQRHPSRSIVSLLVILLLTAPVFAVRGLWRKKRAHE
jgi:hypothetical protein